MSALSGGTEVFEPQQEKIEPKVVLEKQERPKKPTRADRISTYEQLLHDLQFNMEVTMNDAIVRELLRRACAWSTSHRDNGGERTGQELEDHINRAFWRLGVR